MMIKAGVMSAVWMRCRNYAPNFAMVARYLILAKVNLGTQHCHGLRRINWIVESSKNGFVWILRRCTERWIPLLENLMSLIR